MSCNRDFNVTRKLFWWICVVSAVVVQHFSLVTSDCPLNDHLIINNAIYTLSSKQFNANSALEEGCLSSRGVVANFGNKFPPDAVFQWLDERRANNATELIRVWIGMRAEAGSLHWFWSDGSEVQDNSLPNTNTDVCQHMSLYYSGSWDLSPENCDSTRAFGICQMNFAVVAELEKHTCIETIVNISWEHLSLASLFTDQRSIFIEASIAGTDKSLRADFVEDILLVKDLPTQYQYDITVSLKSKRCDSFVVSDQHNLNSTLKTPTPPGFAKIIDGEETCLVEWKHENPDVHGYEIASVNGNFSYIVDISTEEKVITGQFMNAIIHYDDIQNITDTSFTILAYTCLARSLPGPVFGKCNSKDVNTSFWLYLVNFISIGVIVILTIAALRYHFLKRKKSRTAVRNSSSEPEEDFIVGKASSIRRYSLGNITLDQLSGMDFPEDENNANNYTAVVRGEDLKDWYQDGCANDFQVFSKQYTMINRKVINKSNDISQLSQNVKKNRYINIFPYDETRVVLHGGPQHDYINASYVPGYNMKRLFIASQGPTAYTTKDFWRMIWEQKTKVIVMLCKTVEGNKIKCTKYWPDLHQVERHEIIDLETLREEEVVPGIIQRTMLLTRESENRTAIQFHFTRWPDHGIPDDTTTMLKLRNLVNTAAEEYEPRSPIVVNCSAGVGRSGSYIAMDILFDQLDDLGQVDVIGCVLKLRESRVHMVQTLDQYVFVHKLVLHHYVLKQSKIEESSVEKDDYLDIGSRELVFVDSVELFDEKQQKV